MRRTRHWFIENKNTITRLQPIQQRWDCTKCYTPVSGWQPLGPKQVSTQATRHLVEALAMCPTQPQEYSIRKHCLNQAPCSVLSAITCHLPQLVLFHFITVGAANSRNDRNRNCSSETLRWKPANHTCKANEPVHFTTSLAFQLTVQTLEMLSDMSDLLIFDNSQKKWQCVCFTSN